MNFYSLFVSKGNKQNDTETSPRNHQCGRAPPNTPESVNGLADPYRNSRNANQLTPQNPNRRMSSTDLHLRLDNLSGISTASTISAKSSCSSFSSYKSSSPGSSDPNSMFSPGQKRQPVRHSHRSKCLTYSFSSKTEWEDSSTSSDESYYIPKKK